MKRLFRCQSNVLMLDEPKLCISSRMKPLLRQLRASEVHYHMAAPGYLVFPGKAFHCDILLNIGVHFKAGRIQFLEFFGSFRRSSERAMTLPFLMRSCQLL